MLSNITEFLIIFSVSRCVDVGSMKASCRLRPAWHPRTRTVWSIVRRSVASVVFSSYGGGLFVLVGPLSLMVPSTIGRGHLDIGK